MLGEATGRVTGVRLRHAESGETRAHLMIANARGYLTQSELEDLLARYNEVEKMLTGLIRYLKREARTDRG